MAGLMVASCWASPALAADKRECIQASDDGQALRLDGKLLEARDKFLVCADRTCPSVVSSACSEWLTGLDAQIPSILPTARDGAGHDVVGATLAIDGGASKALDGRPVSLDPGTHALRVRAPDGRESSQSVVLREGEQRRAIELVLGAPLTTTTPSSARPVPWAAIGVTAVAAVAWGTFAGFAIAGHLQYRDLASTCGTTCTQDAVRPVDTKFWVADVSLGVAIVATVVATVLYIVAPKAKPTTALAGGVRF